MIGRERQIVALVRRRHPRASLVAVVEDDQLSRTHPEYVLEEEPERADVGGQQVEMVEPSDIHAASREALGLILQRRLQIRRRRAPFGVVVETLIVGVGYPDTWRDYSGWGFQRTTRLGTRCGRRTTITSCA